MNVSETIKVYIQEDFKSIIKELNEAKAILIAKGCTEDSISGEISSDYDSYGNYSTGFYLTGWRPETLVEENTRKNNHKVLRANEIERLKSRLKQLEENN